MIDEKIRKAIAKKSFEIIREKENNKITKDKAIEEIVKFIMSEVKANDN